MLYNIIYNFSYIIENFLLYLHNDTYMLFTLVSGNCSDVAGAIQAGVQCCTRDWTGCTLPRSRCTLLRHNEGIVETTCLFVCCSQWLPGTIQPTEPDGWQGMDVSVCERNRFALRMPEKCSLGRAIGVDAAQVSRFFDNLNEVYGKHRYPPSRIYSVDETGLSTVPDKVAKVYAEKGKRAVSKIVSADRGQLVTAVCCISASGLYVPPALIFPRQRKTEELYREAPPGTLAMISDSGCMTTDLFVEWLEHFQAFVKSSQEDPVLLILDNHVSHCSLEAIDTCRKYNICLVSLPPHASHKLQPLDVGFFGPLKTAYSVECDNWIAGHPGRPITHLQVAGLFRAAYDRVGNPERAINAFKATGIYPFRPTIFDDVDLLQSDVTDRPLGEADPSTNAPATRSSSRAHTMTRDPVTTTWRTISSPHLRPLQASQWGVSSPVIYRSVLVPLEGTEF